MKTRLYFILADENLFHPKFFSICLKRLDKDYEVIGVTVAKDRHKEGFFGFLKQQMSLWGFLGFFYIAFISSLYSILDKFGIIKNLSIRSICKEKNIKYTESFNVNEESHLSYLRDLKLDIIVSSCGHIFKKDLLKLPKIACINRHTALLPKYGGVLPVFWAMYYGEKNFGVSIHYMVEKIDKGDILSQVEIPLKKENSLFKNYILAFNKSVDALLLALENIKKKKIVNKFHPNEKQYFSFPISEEIRKFKQKGYKVFSYKDLF